MNIIQKLKDQWLFKMNLILIVAISENNIIGNKGVIPWRIKEDLTRFKEMTLNHPVIMGRKTYESIPEKFRPLPQRKNIILSKSFQNENGIYIARNLEEALNLTDNQDSYIIGGREVYNLFLPLATNLEITRVHENYEGDTFFPEINLKEWNLIKKEDKISEKGINFSFLSYKKASYK